MSDGRRRFLFRTRRRWTRPTGDGLHTTENKNVPPFYCFFHSVFGSNNLNFVLALVIPVEMSSRSYPPITAYCKSATLLFGVPEETLSSKRHLTIGRMCTFGYMDVWSMYYALCTHLFFQFVFRTWLARFHHQVKHSPEDRLRKIRKSLWHMTYCTCLVWPSCPHQIEQVVLCCAADRITSRERDQ